MENQAEQAIIQQIQAKCDTLYVNMKREKDLQGKTNHGISDRTGVPLSTTAKFFSGRLSNPGVFTIAAICIDLGISLDALIGIKAETHEKDAEKIHDLETRLEKAEHDLQQSERLNGYLSGGIKERKPVIYALTALCSIMALFIMAYMSIDVSNDNFGFIRAGHFSVFGIVVFAITIVAVGLSIHVVIKKKKKKRHKKETKER